MEIARQNGLRAAIAWRDARFIGAKMDNLGSLLIETYKVSADAPALDDTDRALTYRQLSEAGPP